MTSSPRCRTLSWCTLSVTDHTGVKGALERSAIDRGSCVVPACWGCFPRYHQIRDKITHNLLPIPQVGCNMYPSPTLRSLGLPYRMNPHSPSLNGKELRFQLISQLGVQWHGGTGTQRAQTDGVDIFNSMIYLPCVAQKSGQKGRDRFRYFRYSYPAKCIFPLEKPLGNVIQKPIRLTRSACALSPLTDG